MRSRKSLRGTRRQHVNLPQGKSRIPGTLFSDVLVQHGEILWLRLSAYYTLSFRVAPICIALRHVPQRVCTCMHPSRTPNVNTAERERLISVSYCFVVWLVLFLPTLAACKRLPIWEQTRAIGALTCLN